MDEELIREAESLLADAEQAVDGNANGLFDRGDLINFLSRFCRLTRHNLREQARMEKGFVIGGLEQHVGGAFEEIP